MEVHHCRAQSASMRVIQINFQLRLHALIHSQEMAISQDYGMIVANTGAHQTTGAA
jgi:hypothetical protein